jgi:exopolyphosphatase/guanosine-5'-triphosphate,3'-diphosphate pyrophosphatase
VKKEFGIQMIRACIDIGSNSVLLLAVRWSGKIEEELLNCSHITSLGKDLDKNKCFHPDSMHATYEALLDYKTKLQKIKIEIEDVVVTATEAARVSTNASDFFKKIKNEIGFNIKIITAEEEAYFTALGVISGVSSTSNNLVIMDIGGASTELIKISKSPFKVLSTISFPVGSVRATDWKNSNQFNQKMAEILSTEVQEYISDTMICVAGSMTSLATMFIGNTNFNDTEIDGLIIELDSFKNFTLSLKGQSEATLLLKFPFLGKRAPMVPAASEVALLLLEKLQVKKLQVSTRGLRYGVVCSN